jgi:hypothetical protein
MQSTASPCTKVLPAEHETTFEADETVSPYLIRALHPLGGTRVEKSHEMAYLGGLQTRRGQHVQRQRQDARHELHVRFLAAAARLFRERLVLGETPQQQLQVVHRRRQGHIGAARLRLNVAVEAARRARVGGAELRRDVPSETGGEVGVGHLRSPEREESVAAGVRVVERRTLPFLSTASTSTITQLAGGAKVGHCT